MSRFYSVKRLWGLAVLLSLVLSSFLFSWAEDQRSDGSAAYDPIVILAYGDSLTAGFGLRPSKAYPALLEKRLRAEGYRVRFINAGLSGDTTGGGLERLDWALAETPDIAILELGANDALQGLEPAAAKANLDAMLSKMKAAGARVLLAGMLAPPNMGDVYEQAFKQIFPDLAEKHEVALMPFFLEGVAARPEFLLPDMLHPNEAGTEIIADNVYKHLKPLIDAELQERLASTGS
jgi:acyl-CoA thioesterase-1